jgi:hypothetical protein
VAARVIASAALDGVVTMSHLPSVLSLQSPHGGLCGLRMEEIFSAEQ